MKRRLLPLISLLALLTIAGCASVNQQRTAEAPFAGKTLSANGYANFGDNDAVQIKQRWLSTQQQAKLNAYRGLADQLYYEPVGGNKTVGSQVVGSEAYRIYLDGYLREARASDYRTVKNTLKTTMTLTLTPRFYQCMGGNLPEIERCLREDNKLEITRLGYRQAQTTTVNLACGNRDCSDQFYVQGFSNDRAKFNDSLLKIGLYDSEWLINTGTRTLFNALLLQGMVNAL
jgi:hypothetical protein